MTTYTHRPPYYDLLGLEFPEGTEHYVFLPADPRQQNSKGHVHGGATLGMADAIASRVVREARPEVEALSTVSLTCNFLAPARGDLRGFGHYLGGGKSIVTTDFSVRDAQDTEVIHGLVTVRVFVRRP